jgi:hypothetical protein
VSPRNLLKLRKNSWEKFGKTKLVVWWIDVTNKILVAKISVHYYRMKGSFYLNFWQFPLMIMFKAPRYNIHSICSSFCRTLFLVTFSFPHIFTTSPPIFVTVFISLYCCENVSISIQKHWISKSAHNIFCLFRIVYKKKQDRYI